VRAAAAVRLLFVCLTIAGCGGSDGESPSGGGQPAPGTLEALWRAPGPDVATVAGTSDYGPGRVRYSFLIVDDQGRAYFSDRARMWIARGLRQKPFARATARLEKIVVPGGYEPDAPSLFVAELDLPKPGKYWVLAEPVGGAPIQALGQLEVKADPAAPDVGDRVPASRTPTLRSANGDVAALTTRRPPDRTLLEHSVAESLAAKAPFVVSFATPEFCASRTCGPVVDVVEATQRRLGASPVRFIHVEVYEDNDPAKGTNRWVREWRLPTEPWTFLVGADGRVKRRFEGAFSLRELEQAVRESLL
jgi:hypothetical protein